MISDLSQLITIRYSPLESPLIASPLPLVCFIFPECGSCGYTLRYQRKDSILDPSSGSWDGGDGLLLTTQLGTRRYSHLEGGGGAQRRKLGLGLLISLGRHTAPFYSGRSLIVGARGKLDAF